MRTAVRTIAIAIAIAVVLMMATVTYAAQDRVALVIGMADYQSIVPLDNTHNDARSIAAALGDIGFGVTLSLDASRDELELLLNDFAFRSETADLALIYFAGHGVEVQGENFLIPIDADVTSNLEVQRQSVSLKQLLASVERARKMRIVILDSCRDNPLGDAIDLTQATQTETQSTAQATRGGGGLAAANPDRGTLVAFAAKDGQVALDGDGTNSPYARALIDRMVKPGLEISLMFRQVRDQVLRDTGNQQEPHTYGSLTGVPFYLAGAPPETWNEIKSNDEEQLVALADLGDTRSMVGLAQIRLNPNDERFNPNEGVAFLERAANAGSPEAQYLLAVRFEKGRGVDKNANRALELYRAAAEQDYPSALNELGFMYFQGGLGLPADPQQALRYFERAADLRLPEAQFNYAVLIDEELVPGRGPEDAGHYLYTALRSGNRDVLNILIDHPNQFKPATRRALQEQLKKFEFYKGTIDGSFGAGTQRGIRRAYGLTD